MLYKILRKILLTPTALFRVRVPTGRPGSQACFESRHIRERKTVVPFLHRSLASPAFCDCVGIVRNNVAFRFAPLTDFVGRVPTGRPGSQACFESRHIGERKTVVPFYYARYRRVFESIYKTSANFDAAPMLA